jgi:hypothetical protein
MGTFERKFPASKAKGLALNVFAWPLAKKIIIGSIA